MHCARIVSLMVFSSVVLSGCGLFAPSISDENKKLLDTARRTCGVVDVTSSTFKVKTTPVINGKSISDITANIGGNGAKTDAVLYQFLWYQDVCTVVWMNPGLPNKMISEWSTEIGNAFSAVPQEISGTYDEKITRIKTARDKHIEALKTKSDALLPTMDFDVFDKAIPSNNFLKITTLHSEITLPDGALIKGVSFAKSTLKNDLVPSEMSEEVRPALQQIRPTIAAYAMGRAGPRDTLEAAVSAIYNLAATKVRNTPPPPPATTTTDKPAQVAIADVKPATPTSPTTPTVAPTSPPVAPPAPVTSPPAPEPAPAPAPVK